MVVIYVVEGMLRAYWGTIAALACPKKLKKERKIGCKNGPWATSEYLSTGFSMCVTCSGK
jgi:hypothetical protein